MRAKKKIEAHDIDASHNKFEDQIYIASHYIDENHIICASQ